MADRRLKVLVIIPGRITSTDIRICLPLDRLVEKGEIQYRIEYLQELAQDAVHWSDVVLIQKTSSPKGLHVLDEARLYGKPVIYEIDDNLVDPLPPYHPVHDYYCKAVRNLVERSIRQADIVTVSTKVLRDRFSEFNDHVRLVPNTVDFKFVSRSKNRTGKTRIGYSGTKTHKGDFEVVLPALKRLAAQYKDRISLVFLGYLPEELEDVEGVEEWQYTYEYSAYLQRLGSLGIDIAIAPLMDHLFNSYKSNIKYVEYSASGIAGIYSRCSAYTDSVQDGITGLLVDHTEQEWYTSIRTLLDNPLAREELASEAHRDVRKNFHIDKACDAWNSTFENALRTGSKKKGIMKKAPRTGVKKVFYIGSGFLWPHTYIDDFLTTAFSSLGLEVVFYPIIPPPFHEQTLALYNNFNSGFIKYTLSGAITPDHLLRTINRENPDFLFCLQSYMIPRDVLFEISKCGISSAVWFMDEPYDVTRSVTVGTFFSHVFLQDSSTVAYHRRHGNPNTYYLPHGFDDREIHIKGGTRKPLWDISLVGMGFPRRVQAVNAIAGKGNILLVGARWEGFLDQEGIETKGVLSPEEAADIYRQSRINLNIHREEKDHSISTFDWRAVSPNGSLFYIAGCNGFQIVDDSRKEIEDFFIPNKEIVLYRGLDDLREKVDFYLKHDAERLKISEAAYRRAVSEHTYSHRLKKILEIVECGAKSPTPHFYEKTVVFPCKVDTGGMFRGENAQVMSFGGEEEGVRNIHLGKEADISTALNAAFLEASSPYTVVTSLPTQKLREKISLSMGYFSKNPELGAVAFQTDEGRLALLVFSNRILWRTGAFKTGYWGVETTIKDILFRLRERSYGIVYLKDTGIPLDEDSEISPEKASEDQLAFSIPWGERPEDRLKAKKLVRLSYTLKDSGNEEVVQALRRKALKLDPDYSDACREMGALLLQNGKAEDAGGYLEKAWFQGKDDVQAGILYSLYLITTQREREAIGILERLSDKETSPRERTSILFNLGRCHRKLGKSEEAVRHFKKALEVDPNYLHILKELFSIYMESNDYRAALDCTEKIIKLQPHNVEAMNDMGVLLCTLGRKIEALDVLKRAVGMDGNHNEALENLRQVAASLGIPIREQSKS